MWSFQQAGISLPHSSQALAQGGQPVSMDQIQPGDLVTYYSDASHVAIYIGDGMMVHASTLARRCGSLRWTMRRSTTSAATDRRRIGARSLPSSPS